MTLKKFTGEFKTLKGYPLLPLVAMLPIHVTQFAAVEETNDLGFSEWVISYLEKTEIPEKPPEDQTPLLA